MLKSFITTYILDKLILLLPAFVVILAVRLVRTRRLRERYEVSAVREVGVVLFMYYLAFMLSMTVVNFNLLRDWQGVHGFFARLNLVPFKQFADAFAGMDGMSPYDLFYFLLNLLGNLAAFLPFGLCVPLLWRVSVPRVVLYGAGLSLFIEAAQLPFNRGSDVDDIILNTASTALGCLLYLLIRDTRLASRFKLREKDKTA